MYEEVVEALQKAFDVMPEGVDLSKGGLGELAMAHALGLGDLANLPSSPCLSSRIETGIPILVSNNNIPGATA